jgi:hypothetical protein
MRDAAYGSFDLYIVLQGFPIAKDSSTNLTKFEDLPCTSKSFLSAALLASFNEQLRWGCPIG